MPQHTATAARLAPWLLAAAALAQAAVLVAGLANPLVYSDNWTFIDTFLRVALEQGAGVGDLLVKRAGVDHAQPLNKLLMLANARWGGLDFSLEAWFALACAAATWAMLWRARRRDQGRGAMPRAATAWMALVLVALVAPVHVDVIAYPMVLMFHAQLLLSVLALHAAWRVAQGARPWGLLLAGTACGIAGDNAAIVLFAAAAMALALAGWRGAAPRPGRAAGWLLLVLVACRLAYALLGEVRGSTNPAFDVGLGVRLAALAAQWRDAWAWLATPLTGGLLSKPVLQALAGDHWQSARTVLALGFVAAHLAFWWRALRVRAGGTWFVAVALMLLFYGLVAGLLYGRVFLRGAVFLDQGRYAIFYQVGLVALLLMAAAPGAVATGRARLAAWAAAACVLLAQVPMGLVAHDAVPAHRAAYRHMAASMAAVAADPRAPPADCAVGIDVCVFAEPVRVALMAMLVEHRLNLFSPAFRARHPDLAAVAPMPATAPPTPPAAAD